MFNWSNKTFLPAINAIYKSLTSFRWYCNIIFNENLEDLHEFLHGYTDVFTNNIYTTNNYTYHDLRGMIQNKDIVVVKGDKDSSIVTVKKSGYVSKSDTIIDRQYYGRLTYRHK